MIFLDKTSVPSVPMSVQTSSTSRLFRQVGTVKLRKGPMTALFLTGHRQLISDSGSMVSWSPCCGHSHGLVMGTLCTGGADSWHHMGRHRGHVRMNSVGLVYFNIWLISLLSCMFSLCLSKCHTKYLKIRYPFRWWSSYNHGPNSAVCSICTWPIPINIPPIW